MLFDNVPLYLRSGKRRLKELVIPAFESDSMAKRDHTPPPSGTVSSAAPPEAIRMEFARRLQAALNERAGPNPNSHAAWRRCSSTAASAETIFPSTCVARCCLCRQRLKVLEMKTSELLPARASPSAGAEYPPMSVKDIGEGRVWLQINRSVTWGKGLEILRILQEDDKNEGS